jgi:hypothetical protein
MKKRTKPPVNDRKIRAVYYAPDGRRLPDGPCTMKEFISVLWRDAQVRIKLELKNAPEDVGEYRGKPQAEVRS